MLFLTTSSGEGPCHQLSRSSQKEEESNARVHSRLDKEWSPGFMRLRGGDERNLFHRAPTADISPPRRPLALPDVAPTRLFNFTKTLKHSVKRILSSTQTTPTPRRSCRSLASDVLRTLGLSVSEGGKQRLDWKTRQALNEWRRDEQEQTAQQEWTQWPGNMKSSGSCDQQGGKSTY